MNRALLAPRHETSFSDVKSSHGVRVVDLDAGTVEVLGVHRKCQIEERLAADSVPESGEGDQPALGQAPRPASRLGDDRWEARRPAEGNSERLGHHSPEFTLRQYVQSSPGMGRTAADTFANAIRWQGGGRVVRTSGSTGVAWSMFVPSRSPRTLRLPGAMQLGAVAQSVRAGDS